MVKHPLQNLDASLGPQPSSGLNVRRTHTRLRLVQKTQFSVTHKHTEYGISAGDMHMDFTCFCVTPGSQPRNSVILCTTKSSSAGKTLTREPSHILIGKMLTVEHPNWPNSKVTAKAGKRVRLQCQTTEREKISPLHVYWRFNPQNLEISCYSISLYKVDRKNSSHTITLNKFRKIGTDFGMIIIIQ